MKTTITLAQFEKIDGLFAQVSRMGDISALFAQGTGEQCREYIQVSNRLLDACVDAIGFERAMAYASAEECASYIIVEALSSSTYVSDGEPV